MPSDTQLSQVAAELDAQIGKMLGKPSPSGDTMAASPEVSKILSDAGCSDPDGVVSALEAAGYYIEKKGEGEKKEKEGKPGDANAEAGAETDITDMPMPDARKSAAKFAFGKQ